MDRVQYCKGGEEMKDSFKSVVALEIVKQIRKRNPKLTLEEVDRIIHAFESGFEVAKIKSESDQELFLKLLRINS
jgi:hypothetical protein